MKYKDSVKGGNVAFIVYVYFFRLNVHLSLLRSSYRLRRYVSLFLNNSIHMFPAILFVVLVLSHLLYSHFYPGSLENALHRGASKVLPVVLVPVRYGRLW
jgi:hypothetical protein